MMNEEDPLKKEWNDNIEPVIEGKNGSYKLVKDKFLGRGGFGIVFVALRKFKDQNTLDKYDKVVVKEFKKSEKWKTLDDWDRQLLILSDHYQEWDPTYILQVIDIFQSKKTNRHYLVTKYACDGNLTERMKTSFKQEEIHLFTIRSAEILQYLHYQALKNYKVSEKGEDSKPIGVIHRDFKPANLVFVEKNNFKSMFLIDFGISKVGYTDYRQKYTNCGTNNYKAPQIAEREPYNAKVDIYSFGCTLFQMIAGERLLGGAGIQTHHNQRERFVKNRLQNLQFKLKLMGPDKMKNSYRWLSILSYCLQYDPERRWSSSELLRHLNSQPYDISSESLFKQFTRFQEQYLLKKQTYEINFEIYRVNIIQDQIFQIFQFLYFTEPRINKFTIYGIVKYAIFFIIDKYNKTKEKARLIKNTDKVNLLKRLIDERKIEEIKKNAHKKMVDQYYKEKDVKGARNEEIGPVENMMEKFPELLKEYAPEPRRIFFEFCFQKKKEIMENTRFSEMVSLIILFMDDFDSYQEIQLTENELKGNVDGVSLKKLYNLRQRLLKKMAEETVEHILDECQVEMSVRSGINKQQKKTDLMIQKRQ